MELFTQILQWAQKKKFNKEGDVFDLLIDDVDNRLQELKRMPQNVFHEEDHHNDDYTPPPIGGSGLKNFEPIIKTSPASLEVGAGVVAIGRKHYLVEKRIFTSINGEYRLKIKITNNNAEIEIEEGSGFEDPLEEVSYIPLFLIDDDKVVADYRSNFCVVARDVEYQ